MRTRILILVILAMTVLVTLPVDLRADELYKTTLVRAAARKAGFKSAGDISPYLRTLIAEHHDTLAVAIR